jgi:hypothetical protein
MIKLIGGVLCMVSVHATYCQAQVRQAEWSTPGAFPGPALLLFLPKVTADVQALKDFVRSSDFASEREREGDLKAVDRIFSRAAELSWGNHYEALLLCLAATMDHARFGVDVPIVGPILWLPLTSEFEDAFQERVRSLPTRIYPDSPLTPAGDRDKLQHFFGSALIAYWSESGQSAERVGDMIETGEEQFIVEGVYDDRDVRANNHGRDFGLALIGHPDALPSDFLLLVVATSGSGPALQESGGPCGVSDER